MSLCPVIFTFHGIKRLKRDWYYGDVTAQMELMFTWLLQFTDAN